MKKLPNILSISRLVISCILFPLGSYPTLFTILYLYCGISDIADGYIARRWKIESALGAKLDSYSDFVFYILITVIFFTHTELMTNTIILLLVISIFVFRILNMIITKIRFGQWGMLHTIANKLSGLLVYFMLPLYLLFPPISIAIGVIATSIALIATLEETFIQLSSKEYNPNRKSIFSNSI